MKYVWLIGFTVLGGLFFMACRTDEQRNEPKVVATPRVTQTTTASTETPSSPTRPSTATNTPDDTAIVASLNDLVIPIETIDPYAPLDDLAPFGALVNDAQVIGLGESTHGTDEFMQMHHRMIRYLIEHHDLQFVALEAPVAGIEIVDRYVQGKHDDSVAAQEGLFYFSFRNTAMWDFIEWLRTYNSNIDEESRVHVVGIDPQHNTMLAPELILDYIASVAPAEEVDQLRAIYDDVQAQTGSEYALKQAQLAMETLTTGKDAFSAASTSGEFQEALHLARMVVDDQQLLNEQRTNPGSLLTVFEHREATMAENVERIVDHSIAGAKVIVCGHNMHVGLGTSQRYREVTTLGERLRVRFGDEYRAVGFDFASGSFTARTPAGLPETFVTEPAPSTMYAARFQQLDASMFLLDLQAIDPTTPAGWWVNERRTMWSIGCCFTPLVDYAVHVNIVETFDLLVFIEETTPTTLLPNTER